MSKHFKDNLVETVFHLLAESHYKGKTVIVAGKKGIVGKQVGKDGDTENDEIYKVRFEDGTVKDVPVRDMEIQSDNKKTGENEMEDLVKEAKLSSGAKGLLSAAINASSKGGHPGANPDNLKHYTSDAKKNAMNFLSKQKIRDEHRDSHNELKQHFSEAKKHGPAKIVTDPQLRLGLGKGQPAGGKVTVKTKSGTKDKVSQEDLEAAASMYDMLRGKKKVNEASYMSAARGIGTSALGGVPRRPVNPVPMNTTTRKPMSQSALDTARNLTNQRRAIENRRSVQQGYNRAKAQERMKNKPVVNKPVGKTPTGMNTTTGKPMSLKDLETAKSVTNQRQSYERGLKVTRDRQALERKLRAPEYEKQDRRALESGKITQRQYDNRQLAYAGRQSEIPKPTQSELDAVRRKRESSPEGRKEARRRREHEQTMERLDRKARGLGYTLSDKTKAENKKRHDDLIASADKAIADFDRRAKTNRGPAYMSRRDRNNLMNRNMQMGRNPYDDRMFYSRNEEVLNEALPAAAAAALPLLGKGFKAAMAALTAYDAYKLAKGLMQKKPEDTASTGKSSGIISLANKQLKSSQSSDGINGKKKKKKTVTPAGKVAESVELTEEELNEILGAVRAIGSRIASGAGRTARAAASRVPGARFAGSRTAQVRHRAKNIKKIKKKKAKKKALEAMTPMERMARNAMRYYLYPQIAGDVAGAAGSALKGANPVNWGGGRRASSQNVYGG